MNKKIRIRNKPIKRLFYSASKKWGSNNNKSLRVTYMNYTTMFYK